MEAMKYGVLVITMPVQLDQPLNTRLLEEIGIKILFHFYQMSLNIFSFIFLLVIL